MENKATGYISIFRSIRTHWLWADSVKLQWWLDILLSANYKESKILIKGTLYDCKRGQTIKSVRTWAKDWRTTHNTVSSFIKLLQSDKMIEVENLTNTTRITVCNYDSYNTVLTTSPPQVTHNLPTSSPEPTHDLNTNNKGNKGNKGKQENKENNPLFDKFWFLYAKSTDKKKCLEKFNKLSEHDVIKIFNVLPGYIESKPDSQFRKNPLTWLNGECWNDITTPTTPMVAKIRIEDTENFKY